MHVYFNIQLTFDPTVERVVYFQDVVERSHLSSDMFTAYLHQNYLHFYEEMEDVVRASEYVSDSDMLTLQWQVMWAWLLSERAWLLPERAWLLSNMV